MNLTLEQARALASCRLYKELDVLQERLRAGDTVTDKEKFEPLQKNAKFVIALVRGDFNGREIAMLAEEWVLYFEKYHKDVGKKHGQQVLDVSQELNRLLKAGVRADNI